MMTIKCLDTGQTTTMDKMEDILKGKSLKFDMKR